MDQLGSNFRGPKVKQGAVVKIFSKDCVLKLTGIGKCISRGVSTFSGRGMCHEEVDEEKSQLNASPNFVVLRGSLQFSRNELHSHLPLRCRSPLLIH